MQSEFYLVQTDGSSFLIADVDVACGTPEHESVKTLAWTAVWLYPIGMWVLNGILLFQVRSRIETLSYEDCSASSHPCCCVLRSQHVECNGGLKPRCEYCAC